jgi:hypothetical protein
MEEGYALLQLHKNDFKTLGEIGKGVSPFPKSVTPSRFCEESPIQLRGLDITPSRLPRIKLKSFRGKFERGTLPLSIE